MDKRTLYFWIERLKISPVERRAVSLLLVLLVSLSLINATLEREVPYEREYYKKLDQAFERRAAIVREKENKILARYEPEIQQPAVVSVVQDTFPADSLKPDRSQKTDNSAEPDVKKVSERIDVNTATAEELQTLPGIGPVYARRIVEYREENGDYTAPEELINIKGIGKKRLEKLKPFIKLKGSTEN